MLSLCKGSDWMTGGHLTWKIFKLLLSIIFKCTECQDKNLPSINSRTIIIPTAQGKKKVEQSKHFFLSVPPIIGTHVQAHTFTHAKKEKNAESLPFSVRRCPTTPLIWLPGRGLTSCSLSFLLDFTNKVSLFVRIIKSRTITLLTTH